MKKFLDLIQMDFEILKVRKLILEKRAYMR